MKFATFTENFIDRAALEARGIKVTTYGPGALHDAVLLELPAEMDVDQLVTELLEAAKQ